MLFLVKSCYICTNEQTNKTKITKMAVNSNSLKDRMEALAINATLTIALDEYSYGTIRTSASLYSIDLNRRFGTRLDRLNKTCTIIRYE